MWALIRAETFDQIWLNHFMDPKANFPTTYHSIVMLSLAKVSDWNSFQANQSYSEPFQNLLCTWVDENGQKLIWPNPIQSEASIWANPNQVFNSI